MERLEGWGETGHSSSLLGATVSKGVMEGSGFLLENLEAPASLKMVFLMFCYLWVWKRARDIYLEVRTGPPHPTPGIEVGRKHSASSPAVLGPCPALNRVPGKWRRRPPAPSSSHPCAPE